MPRIAAALGLVATVAFCIGFNVQRYPLVWEMTSPGPVAGEASPSVAHTTSSPKSTKSAAKEGSTAKHSWESDDSESADSRSARNASDADDDRPANAASRRYASLHPIPIAEPSDSGETKKPKTPRSGDTWKKSAAENPHKPHRDLLAASPEGKYGAAAWNDSADSADPKPAKAKPNAQQGPKRKTPGKRPANGSAKHNSDPQPSARPMVPFSPAAETAAAHDADRNATPASDGENAFRRLPPIDPYQPGPVDPYAGFSPGTAGPSYPSTGVQ